MRVGCRPAIQFKHKGNALMLMLKKKLKKKKTMPFILLDFFFKIYIYISRFLQDSTILFDMFSVRAWVSHCSRYIMKELR
jgi:hypothetical protein